jgi:SM-20-related protein
MISVKEGIIPKKKLDACKYMLDKAAWSYGWPSNKDMPYGHWNVDITKTPKYNSVDVSDRLPNVVMDIWKIVNNAFFQDKAVLTRCYANRHTFGTEGYIHTDTDRVEDQTCVVYMDEKWDVNWGGETSFYSDDLSEIVKSVIPKYGRVAVFPGNIPHCARSIARICPKVRTTLMFKVSIDPKAVFEAETLLVNFLNQIGAKQRKHKRGTLADHLVRTFHILKSNRAGDILALAGGLHSVYGTNAFKSPCLEWSDTRIAQTFGAEVDRIVRLYATVDRPNSIESPDGSLSELDLFLLRCIECANLHDQEELDPQVYPNLCEFAAKLI